MPPGTQLLVKVSAIITDALMQMLYFGSLAHKPGHQLLLKFFKALQTDVLLICTLPPKARTFNMTKTSAFATWISDLFKVLSGFTALFKSTLSSWLEAFFDHMCVSQPAPVETGRRRRSWLAERLAVKAFSGLASDLSPDSHDARQTQQSQVDAKSSQTRFQDK